MILHENIEIYHEIIFIVQIMNEMNKNIGENQLPKEEKLTQLKNSDSYKIMERKRLKHETYDLFTKEVKFHREIMKTNEAEQESHKSLQKSRKKQRPATAKIRNVVEENYPQAKIVVKRPDSSTGLQKVCYFIFKYHIYNE